MLLWFGSSSCPQLTLPSSAASFHSDVRAALADAAAAAAAFSVVVAHVFPAIAASVADAAVRSAASSLHQPSVAPSADALGPVFVVASAAPALASGTAFLVPFGISAPSLEFRCSREVDPAGSPLASHSDERSWACWHCSPQASY